jgi:hypothetical protein
VELSVGTVAFGEEDFVSSSSEKKKKDEKVWKKNFYLPLSTILLSFGRLINCWRVAPILL